MKLFSTKLMLFFICLGLSSVSCKKDDLSSCVPVITSLSFNFVDSVTGNDLFFGETAINNPELLTAIYIGNTNSGGLISNENSFVLGPFDVDLQGNLSYLLKYDGENFGLLTVVASPYPPELRAECGFNAFLDLYFNDQTICSDCNTLVTYKIEVE